MNQNYLDGTPCGLTQLCIALAATIDTEENGEQDERANTDTDADNHVCGAPSLQQSMGVRECIWMNQNYLDGTPCDAGGG
jgi:hypothetical protein